MQDGWVRLSCCMWKENGHVLAQSPFMGWETKWIRAEKFVGL